MLLFDDKYKLQDFGMIPLREYEEPITPFFERKTLKIPGRVGEWDFGAEINGKFLRYEVGIIEYDKTALEHKLNEFISFLFDDFGQPREIKLVRSHEPNKFYTVKISEQISPERLVSAGKFVLPFVAYDPYKYSIVYADEVTWGNENITFESDYLLGHTNDFGGGSIHVTGNQTVNLTVSGLAVEPIIFIEGTANGLILVANEHYFGLPSFTNEKWEIDFNRYVVFRNGQETMIDLRNFYLMPGNNQIHVIGNNIDIELSVKFRDKYI